MKFIRKNGHVIPIKDGSEAKPSRTLRNAARTGLAVQGAGTGLFGYGLARTIVGSSIAKKGLLAGGLIRANMDGVENVGPAMLAAAKTARFGNRMAKSGDKLSTIGFGLAIAGLGIQAATLLKHSYNKKKQRNG